MLKDQYFPHDSFINAKCEGRASWVWSNLLEMRDFIICGARWQVMSGNKINVWTDNWVPGIPNGHLNPRVGDVVDKTQVVASIIDPNLRTWRTEEFDAFFF